MMLELSLMIEVIWNFQACKGKVCIDLSPHQNHGQLEGQTCAMWDIKVSTLLSNIISETTVWTLNLVHMGY